jgi:hypothetical protein
MVAKKRLGEMLLEAGVIDETQLLSALGHQRKWGGKLGQALVDLHLATEGQIVSALAQRFGFDIVNVAALRPSPALDAALRLVPRELALRHTLLPIAADTSTLNLAMGDPSNVAVIDEIAFRTGRRVKVALAGDREISAAVRRLYYAEEQHTPEAIPIDDAPPEAPLETTRDPFAAMPDHIREGYFNRPAHTIESEAHRAPAPARRPAPAAVPPAPARAPVAAPARAPARPQGVAHERAGTGSPPTLARSPEHGPFLEPPDAPAAGEIAGAPGAASDDMGEPILATDLLVDGDEGPVEGPRSQRERTPKEMALLDALARLARGEESAFLKPGRLAAALAKVLLERGLISEAELLEALTRR